MALSSFQGWWLWILVLVLYTQTKNWLSWRALKKWGKQNGCDYALKVPNKLPGGVERLLMIFKNFNELDILDDLFVARATQMGRYTYRVFGVFNRTQVMTFEPANIQTILALKFEDFDLGRVRRQNFFDLFGNGIFTAEGEAWAHYRHQIKPQFSREQVSDLEPAGRHLDLLFKALPEENSSGWIEKVDLMRPLFRFTMDVSTEFLFGQSVNSQSTVLHSQDSGNATEVKNDMSFAEAMDFASGYIVWRWQLQDLFWLANSKDFKRACKFIKDYVDELVRLALDAADNKGSLPISTGEPKKERYVFLNGLIEETKDPIELRDQLLQLLLAGRDTTSSLISWMLILLARHPSEFASLRSIIISSFGTASSPTQPLTFETLAACKPLNYVLFEALRLYPTVPINGRIALRDTILPMGGGKDGTKPVAIRKGEQVGFSAYVLHRRKDIWGEDADDFKPARWEGRKLGWDFIPFSGGPRICIGQQYAMNAAKFVVVKMLQRYDQIEALEMGGKLKKGLSLTLSPGDGVKVRMHRAVV